MTTLRMISMLALSALTLTTCATVPDLTDWTPCEDGTYCPAGTHCSTDGESCLLPPACGDGMLTSPEECDDGNPNDGDGCDSTCTLTEPVCGDCIISGGEECDDGNPNDGDGCDNCRRTPGMLVSDEGPSCRGKGKKPPAPPL